LPEVLRVPLDDGAPRVLVGPRAVLDPATAAVLDRALAEATATAYREGEAAGRLAAVEDARAAAARLHEALGRILAQLDEGRREASRASLELAHLAATAVLDRTPPDDATQVLERVRAALDVLDEEPVQALVNPADAPGLAAGADRRIEVVPDPTVAQGDVRLQGRTCGAELTRAAMVEAALEVLGEGAA
jgi:flagellar biosynthesis/type III secretory pathway protein FliH